MDKLDKKTILLKIGSNTLTKETNQISRGKIEDLARQIALLKDEYQFIIVSSGAIAAAKQFVDLEHGKTIGVKQALAAIGQPHLMRMFQENFRELGLLTSQCLLSYADFEREVSKENISNTIKVLLEHGYIPIINENDTVATDEIRFGDNDKLAALTANLLEVDLVIFATNTNGIYRKKFAVNGKKQTISKVQSVGEIQSEIEDQHSTHGTGGMQSKVDAVHILSEKHIEAWIVNGLEDGFIIKALKNENEFTKIENN